MTDLENFVTKQLVLLDVERAAEVEENKALQENSSFKDLQKKGICIPKLRLASSSTGLYGRSLGNFESYWPGNCMSSHIITSGDIVGVGNLTSDGTREMITSGVVTRVTDAFITVAFEKDSDFSILENDVQYTIIKLANDVTYRRLKRVLKSLHQHSDGRNTQMIDVFFGRKNLSSIDASTLSNIQFFNSNLNDAQKEAVKFALLQKEVSILHGPPGTGKTTTIVECILQAVAQKLKILACAPSNVAVDNLVEKLASQKVKMVRLGHPARFLPGIQQYSLDAVISRCNGSEVIDDLHKEIDKLKTQIGKTKGSATRRSLWAENKNLLKDVKQREKSIIKEVLKNADVVLSTLTSATDDGPIKHLPKDHFNVCFIDECSQALEASCWIPLMKVPKCVLAGDHNQLPPTIISKKAAEEGLEVTLMERLLKIHGDMIKKMLTVQYRMNQIIMQWPSKQLYDDKLEAHISVSDHLLKDLHGVDCNEDTMTPLLLIDTAGCHLDELEIDDEESKGNEGEADLVVLHVENLTKSGINAADIAVITPYNLQVDLIKSKFSGRHPKLEIKSVDGFQGREKEAVVLSLVRSNDKGEVGFLSENRRINVAITRAKRHLTVICNSETVSHHQFLKSFIDFCGEKGEVRTAVQYENEIGQFPVNIMLKKSLPKTSEGTSIKKKATQFTQKKTVTCDSMQNSNKVYWEPKENRLVVMERYKSIIKEFLESKRTSLSFPPTLTAFDRRIVHEISEELGLAHTSTGEGMARCVDVRKIPISTETEFSETITEPLVTHNDFQKLEEIYCEGATTSSAPGEKNSHKVKKAQGAVTKKTTKPKLKVLKLSEGDSEDNFDTLIQQVMKADKICSYETCKKSVATLAQVCQFCNGRFCFNHFIPEVHGCGDAVKSYARSRIRKEHALYPGSGKPQKKVDPIKHTYLQNKLDKKITEMSKQRKAKSKS